jgi:hypothetical protein
LNLLTHCALCGTRYSFAYPDAHPATDASRELMPCPCEAWHALVNREARKGAQVMLSVLAAESGHEH